MTPVDAVRLGAVCRAIRIKKKWRQSDLAERAKVSRASVSRIESGRIARLRVDALLSVVEALGGNIDFIVRWQGAELDRLLNARHSALHDSVARWFRTLPGWAISPEVSFVVRGERGVIDILAYHAATRTLLVIELKTEIVDINQLMGALDRKQRLASLIARVRGWFPNTVAVWVIVATSVTNRRRVESHSSTLRTAFQSDGRSVDRWMRKPTGTFKCLSFWSYDQRGSTKPGLATVKRVRKSRAMRGRASQRAETAE